MFRFTIFWEKIILIMEEKRAGVIGIIDAALDREVFSGHATLGWG
jgi:hypothetical protein